MRSLITILLTFNSFAIVGDYDPYDRLKQTMAVVDSIKPRKKKIYSVSELHRRLSKIKVPAKVDTPSWLYSERLKNALGVIIGEDKTFNRKSCESKISMMHREYKVERGQLFKAPEQEVYTILLKLCHKI